MCVGYSTLGKKENGSLKREESKHNKLLLLWILHHVRSRTPLLLHENVRGFCSESLDTKLKKHGYTYLGSIKTIGADAGLGVNPRKRVYLRLQYFPSVFC